MNSSILQVNRIVTKASATTAHHVEIHCHESGAVAFFNLAFSSGVQLGHTELCFGVRQLANAIP
jgi:hypothetical protein